MLWCQRLAWHGPARHELQWNRKPWHGTAWVRDCAVVPGEGREASSDGIAGPGSTAFPQLHVW